uniref:GLOBIN domain-containing protein n=1 Tax=Meloidogyne hapla TaxID=6305 RepID=A0A1I8BSB2_MELHA
MKAFVMRFEKAFIQSNPINKDPENKRQNIIIGCWHTLMDQSRQFINLIKWGNIEDYENIAGSSRNTHPKPPYNVANLFGKF